MKEALKKLLLTKYAGVKAAPVMPGLAESTAALDKVRRDMQEPPQSFEPVGTDDLPPAAEPMAVPPAISAPLAANKPGISAPVAPAPMAQPAPQQPTAMEVPSQYNDDARKQLYDSLAKRMQQGRMAQALGGVADTISRAGGSAPTTYASDINKQTQGDTKLATDQFEAGRKGSLEDISTNLALKKAGREETEYGDQNNPNSQMSKLAVSLAQKYSPNEAKANGWVPGQTSYADVIKVLPIMEKGIALETARSNRELTVGLKTQQDDENRLAKLGEAMSTEKMRSGSVGQMSQSLAGIGKLKALMSGYKGNLTPQEWQEAAIAWNRILTQGGTGGGEHSIEALVPHSLKGNIMGQIQWLTNDPTGTAQQEFAKRLQLGMDREEKYATGYVNKYKVGRLMDFQDVASRKADEVRMKLESQGIGFQDVAGVNPGLASKLWPQGSGAGTAPKQLSGGWTVRR
jgi:hypothetical protein